MPTGFSKCFLKSRDWIKVCFRSENNTTSFPWSLFCAVVSDTLREAVPACFHSQAAGWGWRCMPGGVLPGAVQPGPGFPPLAAPDTHGHPGFAFLFHSSSINGLRSGKLTLIPSGSSSNPQMSCANAAHKVVYLTFGECLPELCCWSPDSVCGFTLMTGIGSHT